MLTLHNSGGGVAVLVVWYSAWSGFKGKNSEDSEYRSHGKSLAEKERKEIKI